MEGAFAPRFFVSQPTSSMPRPRKPTGLVLEEPHCPESLKYVMDTCLAAAGGDEESRNRERRDLRELYDKSKRSGVVKVVYRQIPYGGVADGRHYAQGAGLQRMNRRIRASLVRDMERRLGEVIADLDIHKCQPTLFVQESARLSVRSSPRFLSGFIADPDAFLQLAERDAGASPDQAKQLVNSMLYLGGVDGWLREHGLTCDRGSELYRKAEAARACIGRAVKECMRNDAPLAVRARQSLISESAAAPTEFEVMARFQHLLLSRAENACMQAAYKHLETTSHKAICFVFDGMMVAIRLSDGGTAGSLPAERVKAMIEKLCDDMSRAVRANTPYAVTFKHKPWDTSVTIPEASGEALDDVTATQRFIAWLAKEGHRLVRCGDRMFLYQPEVGVYKDVSKSPAELRGLMSRCAEIEAYGRSVMHMSKVLVLLPTFCAEDPDFLVRADSAGKGRLAFDNGVYDFASGELLPFSPHVVLFAKLSHRFPETPEEIAEVEAVVAEIEERVVDSIWGPSAGFVMEVTSRAMAGHVEDKRFMFCIGDGNAGKGVWMAICKSGFCLYVGSINSGNLVSTRRSDEGDQAKALSWLLAVAPCRQVFASEFKVGAGREIDGTIVKMLSTGGEAQTARQNNENERDFVFQGLVTVFANDVPPVSGVSSCEATRERLTYVEMPYRFLNGEYYTESKHLVDVVREGDPDIKEWVNTPEVGRAFAYMVCKAYVAEKPDMPPCVQQYTATWIKGTRENVSVLHDVLEEAAGHEVAVADVLKAVTARGVIMSANKLGREVKKAFKVTSEPINKGDGKTVRVYKGLRFLVGEVEASASGQ